MEGLFNGKNTGFQQKMGESTWNLLGISLELLRLKVMFDVLIGCTTEESTMFFFGLVSKSKFLPAKLWIVGSTTLPKPCFFLWVSPAKNWIQPQHVEVSSGKLG